MGLFVYEIYSYNYIVQILFIFQKYVVNEKGLEDQTKLLDINSVVNPHQRVDQSTVQQWKSESDSCFVPPRTPDVNRGTIGTSRFGL